MAVMLPTGNSAGTARVRANVSAKRQKMAPNKMEKVKTARISFPKMSLTIWGIISPIKPMTPQHDTAVATTIEEITSTDRVNFLVFIPVVCAVSFPNCIIFNSFE